MSATAARVDGNGWAFDGNGWAFLDGNGWA